MDDIDLLTTALYKSQKTGEPILISYTGGSQPNTTRLIFPVDIRFSEVTVQCLTTEKEKTLELEKMSLRTQDVKPYDISNAYHDTLEEFLAVESESLCNACKEAGFEVALRKNNIKVFYRTEENGKKKKVDILRLKENLYDLDEIFVFSRKPYRNTSVALRDAKNEFLKSLAKVFDNYKEFSSKEAPH